MSPAFRLDSIWPFFFLVLCLQDTHAQTTVDISIESNPHFIGWYLGPTGTQALTDPNTWTTSGTYAAGCSGSACSFATLCTANTLFYNNNESLVCTSARCYTMTIYETSPYGGPSASNLFCAQAWNANTVYRELPASSTTSSRQSRAPTFEDHQRH
ncbi:hypothetical protein BP00DRAFT_476428 [Aspergillus indologenus CBS 114.80]|uniref:Uncharacterized protein n=1 Tax=Aspergillus indologenus CBS 114.80 TaxID=1450541 RepID=A0A2V5IGV6_9EURO|nr:hypothetical protein BP00DRAFT_476428 [Aspergillus indologenus CBS 114.80]